MRVGIFSVKYSPNLGDGLLSECLERELGRCDSRIETVAIDLAGRQDYGQPIRFRAQLLALLNILPASVRRFLATLVLGRLTRKKLSLRFRQRLAFCDAAIVGGGNLFADADLNFPIKINAALVETAKLELPIAVFGVGVSAGWSAQGHALFQTALADARLVMAAVRDVRSKGIWDASLDKCSILRAQVVRDPGLLAVFHYPRACQNAAGKRLGFCITDPVVLRYHSSHGQGDIDADWYCAAFAAMIQAGFEVVLFTNGSVEDSKFLDRNFAPWTEKVGVVISRAGQFQTPAELVQFLSSCNIVVGHRMHACIAAHSFSIPAIGLAWDEKLDSFFEITARSRYLVDPSTTLVEDLAQLAHSALEEGVDPVAHDLLLEEARADVAKLALALADNSSGS